MSGSLRSKQSCWTCKLRKKKCDQSQPTCSDCELLLITCYGYGARPEWMDGGEKERDVVNSLKEIVKRSSRHKAMAKPKQIDQIIKIAPKPPNGATESNSSGHGSSGGHTSTIPSDQEYPSQRDGADVLPGVSTVGIWQLKNQWDSDKF